MSLEEKLELERAEQARWRPLQPERINPLTEKLLCAEFSSPALARATESRNLSSTLTFARQQVPLYREDERWRAASFDDGKSSAELLAQLPVLDKHQLQESFDQLRAERTPKGCEGRHLISSSGTTGRPARVLFSMPASFMFGLLLQRQMRWERVDPNWTQAMIRLPRDIPRQNDGHALADGSTHRAPGWMYLDKLFHTGSSIAFNRSNSIEAQVNWLRHERPEYLITFPGTLEALIYAGQGKPVESLRGLRSISATLTEGMRSRIESATGLHVQQNYGLNEIGIVATRCEGGRYHVNSEHCVVEIVDENGAPCRPGESGRILVTALTNLAMPLVRYDTGDLAEVAAGNCPCGRTLPAFGRVIGRYRAMRYAPEGTSARVNAIAETIEKLPLPLLENLREYQLHQYLDGNFELRLVVRGNPQNKLTKALSAAWVARFGETTPLRILELKKLPPPPGGKQQEFTSDFFPGIDDEDSGQ